MKPRFEILPAVGERTIRLRSSGDFDIPTMEQFLEDYKRCSRALAGSPHLILADLRGMNPTSPEVAAILGEAIEYSRAAGVVCCAHLSDDTITQLQAARLARKSSPHSDVTVDVASREEGERLLDDTRARLDLAGTRASKSSESGAKMGPIELNLAPDRKAHGVIEPARTMSLDAYQRAVAGTQSLWTPDDP
jgi:hypothetical protein